jgi:hypothetical protein
VIVLKRGRGRKREEEEGGKMRNLDLFEKTERK